MDLYEAIESRHSVRGFKPDPVDRAVIDRLVHAAGHAPSSMNRQPWVFHVATGKWRDAVVEAMAASTLHLQEYIGIIDDEHLKAAEEFFANLGGAPVVMVVAVPTPTDDLERINTYVSAGCAIENLSLAARAEGLGCCNVTFSFWVRDRLSQAMSVPDDEEIISIIVVGYPAEAAETTTRKTDISVYHE
ncbi:MAG TPA: nitroreductase [Coriobacteriia bacterium]